MGTKNNPGKFDCYANAEPDEPMFILLARDPVAPTLVRLWCVLRRLFGKNDAPEKHEEAEYCADLMEAWREQNRSDGWISFSESPSAPGRYNVIANRARDGIPDCYEATASFDGEMWSLPGVVYWRHPLLGER